MISSSVISENEGRCPSTDQVQVTQTGKATRHNCGRKLMRRNITRARHAQASPASFGLAGWTTARHGTLSVA